MLRKRILTAALILYAAANAVLYSSLLPLWEGFDEAFHYCYVQSLSVDRRWPVLGRSGCSQEVWQSLQLAPASHVVKQYIPQTTTFSEYFALGDAERRRIRAELESLAPALQYEMTGGPANYEAQQSPLAYLILAGSDYLLRDKPLLARVLFLRIAGAVFSSLAVAFLTLGLGRRLGLPPVFLHAAAFVTLSTQMFYAATAHVTNDWLAIPLSLLLFSAAASLAQEPNRKRACMLAAVLAAGLLTKAYFLSLVPLAAGLLIWLALKRRIGWTAVIAAFALVAALAGPWYWRNLVLYDSISGTQQSASGLGLRGAFGSLSSVRWDVAALTMARQSLWTGNNCDTAFSSTTIAVMWTVLVLAAACYAASLWKRMPSAAEIVILVGSFLFCGGIAYATVLLHTYTAGVSKSTGQWYTQAFFAPVLCLAFLGLARAGRFGRGVAVAIVCLWGYVMAATYVAKLIPMYGGWDRGPVRLAALATWYASEGRRIAGVLDTTALAPPAFLFATAALVTLGSLAIPAALVRLLFVADGKPRRPDVDELRSQ